MKKIIKNFDANEYTSWIISRLSPHNAIITGEISRDIDKQKLKQSVEAVSILENRTSYTISKKKCGFIKCKKKIKIQYVHYHSLDRAIENELRIPFSNYDTLIRIKIIRTSNSTHILICAHHIICDGISLIQFLTKIIRYYNNERSLDPDIVSLNDEVFIPQPVKKILPIINRPSEIITKMCSFKIDDRSSKNIINYANNKNTSLYSALSSILITTFIEIFEINDHVILHIPINLRKKITHARNIKLKFFTSWINLRINHDQLTDHNSLPDYIFNKLKDDISNQNHICNINQLSDLISNRKSDDEIIELILSKSPTLAVSNCGLISIPYSTLNNSDISITDIHFSVNCQSYLGRNSLVSIISFFNSTINIDLCYPSPLISEDEIIAFTKNLEKNINNINN